MMKLPQIKLTITSEPCKIEGGKSENGGMAMARQGRTKNELVKCEYCGEMYSVTYRHCPFCNEDGTGRWDDPDTLQEEYYEDAPRGGGKRLASAAPRQGIRLGQGSGPSVGRIIGWVISLALIIAAAGIVISIVRPLLGFGKSKQPDPEGSSPVVESTTPTPPVEPTGQDDPPGETLGIDAQTPQPTVTTPEVSLTAPTGFTLNREDISFFTPGEVFQMNVKYTPADAHGDVTWTSSDPNVAAVSWNGMVTAVSKGTVKVTASVAGLGEKSCIVRCSFKDGETAPSSQPSAQPTSTPASSSLTLSREDFTLSREGESWRLVVSGTSSAVAWSSSDSSIATVSSDGTVTAVGKGTCRIIAEVDGQTLKCIVRCSF